MPQACPLSACPATGVISCRSPPRIPLQRSTVIDQVDVRGPACRCVITTGVLLTALMASAVSMTVAAFIRRVQAVVFGDRAMCAHAATPYVRNRSPTTSTPSWRPAWPPGFRVGTVQPFTWFAPLVGLVFAAVGVLGFAAGAHPGRHRSRDRIFWAPRSSTRHSESARAARDLPAGDGLRPRPRRRLTAGPEKGLTCMSTPHHTQADPCRPASTSRRRR